MVLNPWSLLTTATKEVVADAAPGGAWVNRNPRQVSRMDVNGSTPDDIHHAVSIVEYLSPFLI